jgi:hypothetical protein
MIRALVLDVETWMFDAENPLTDRAKPAVVVDPTEL